jgi:dTDP-4-dehydrorhamnose reductase
MSTFIFGASGFVGSALRVVLPGAGGTYHASPVDGCEKFDLIDDEPPSIGFCDSIIIAASFARGTLDRPHGEVMAAATRLFRSFPHVPVAMLSTDAVFKGDRGNYTESDTPDAEGLYGQRQAALDDLLLSLNPNQLVVRTSFVYGRVGARIDQRLSPFVLGDAPDDAMVWPANIIRCPTEVNFLARGICRAMEKGVSGILNIAGGPRSLYDFFVSELAAHGIATHSARTHRESRPSIAVDTSLDTGRMRALLGG